jgi:hypothetical protein
MTTFTTEDREWAYWHNYNLPKYNRQIEIEFFWPLTEQVPLDLDYTNCERPKLTMPTDELNSITVSAATWTTSINPQLTVTPINAVGQLTIGGINVGLDKKPTWLQRQLHKLLGFSWKDK